MIVLKQIQRNVLGFQKSDIRTAVSKRSGRDVVTGAL